MPKMLPDRRIMPILKTGTNLIRIDGYIDKCILKFKEMLGTRKYFAANHSEETSDFIVHAFTRIAIEYKSKFGLPDFAVIGMGNGTSTTAIFNYFSSDGNTTRMYCYHPRTDGSQVIFGLYGQDVYLRHVEQARKLADRIFHTNEVDLTPLMAHYESDTEISNLGYSSLYGIYFAHLIAEFEQGKTFMTIGYDKRDRY
jgi:cysteine synthase